MVLYGFNKFIHLLTEPGFHLNEPYIQDFQYSIFYDNNERKYIKGLIIRIYINAYIYMVQGNMGKFESQIGLF